MKTDQAICEKITTAISLLEDLLVTGQIDVGLLAKQLHFIREDAQNMENGLRNRKKFMIHKGVEEEYRHKEAKETDRSGINTLPMEEEKRKERINLEIIVKESGAVVYQNTVHGGVFSIVEKISDIDENGYITGTTQKLTFGHPLVVWYGFDQLRQTIEGKKIEIMSALQKATEKKIFKNPAIKSAILTVINQ